MPVATTRRARALAASIRDLRERSGMRSRELSAKLGLSHSTVSHWETGKRIPTPEDVASFLGAVGVNGDERERILNLARHATEPNWLTVGMPGVPEQLAGAVDCERDAERITQWSPMIVPGLLQTSDYARVSIGASGELSVPEVESRVFVKMGRREILAEENAVQLRALVGEAALREPVGSTLVMAGQLRYLLAMSERRSVILQVLQAGHGWHPGLHGPFIFYEFPDSPPAVYFEHFSSGAFIEEQGDVNSYRYVISAIDELVMTERQSVRFINDILNDMEQRE